jgi:hypothetical protein
MITGDWRLDLLFLGLALFVVGFALMMAVNCITAVNEFKEAQHRRSLDLLDMQVRVGLANNGIVPAPWFCGRCGDCLKRWPGGKIYVEIDPTTCSPRLCLPASAVAGTPKLPPVVQEQKPTQPE